MNPELPSSARCPNAGASCGAVVTYFAKQLGYVRLTGALPEPRRGMACRGLSNNGVGATPTLPDRFKVPRHTRMRKGARHGPWFPGTTDFFCICKKNPSKKVYGPNAWSKGHGRGVKSGRSAGVRALVGMVRKNAFVSGYLRVKRSKTVSTGKALPSSSKNPRFRRGPVTAGSHQNTPLPN